MGEDELSDSSIPPASEEVSDVESGHGDNLKKKKLVFHLTHRKEYCVSRYKNWIAMSDLFISRGENPPFVACLQVSAWFIPVLLVVCVWDTLSVLLFQCPQLSTINLPGFFLGWHFVMMVLAMYGFMLSYLSSGKSPRTKLAVLSLGMHYFLLIYRVLMELYFDGHRGQWKLYYERTAKEY